VNLAMSIDVEDWFQVENLKAAIPRSRWDSIPLRVHRTTRMILDIFRRTETRATFFCLGWIAERAPDLIREIADAGHEIASHGYAHTLVYGQSIGEFREDVFRARSILEGITGSAVLGYRAPSFSITSPAIDILRDTGHRYDSSFFPISGHDRYATLDLGAHAAPAADGAALPAVVSLRNGLSEVPITTLTIGGKPIPWGGGGYFRLYPYPLFEAGFARAAMQHGGACFYLHPWEVDPDQPRVRGIRRSYRIRHYVNLGRTARRLERLCRRFRFTTIQEMIGRGT
jgi:polysaccharide deacetylase family protein (PEP-CTERM system associated)